MDGHLNKITNLVRPLLLRARRMDSQPLGHLDDSGPGLWGPVHSWVGDSSLRKGLLFTEHSRGKPCRIHKTGCNVKMILGIDGRYIFVALILMIKATDSRFFFFPPHLETLCIGPFFFLSSKTDTWIFKLDYAQQEQSVKREIEKMTRFYNIYSNGASSLKSIGLSFKNERWKFFPNTWVLDSGGRKKWSRRGIIIQTNITIVW